jgi:hypothetical protein
MRTGWRGEKLELDRDPKPAGPLVQDWDGVTAAEVSGCTWLSYWGKVKAPAIGLARGVFSW